MKAIHAVGASPTFERDNQQRRVPIGLDKSWECRRVEGLELMVTSVEQQKERQKKSGTCKSCSHGNHQHNNNNNNGSSCCGSHHHYHHHVNNNNNNNSVDNDLLLTRHQEKSRSLSGLKKNKMSLSASAPQKSLVFDSLTHVEGSSVGRRQKIQADVSHNACLTPENFKVRELEQQVLDLIHQLAQEKHQARQDKISLSKLQQQLARNKSEKPVKEMLMKELDQERRRRKATEQKLKDRNVECCCQNEMMVLKKENTRLNEVVQDLLPYKSKVERLKQSHASSAALLEAELHRLRSKLESLEQDNSLTNMELKKLESIIRNCQSCRSQLVGQIRLDGTPCSDTSMTNVNDSDKTKILLERLKNVEEEKSSLVLENEAQFRHYETCLEDVTNQILDALLVQKTLKEECSHLKCRVVQLEEENESLKNSSQLQPFYHTSMALSRNSNFSASSANHESLCTNIYQPRDGFKESQIPIGRTVSREFLKAAESIEIEDDEDEEEDGCQSSLSLNEILDSAAGSTSSNTDVEDEKKSRSDKKSPIVVAAAVVANQSKTNGSCEASQDFVRCSNNANIFVDMSASDSFALIGSCPYNNGSGQFIHLSSNSLGQNLADVNSNTITKSESTFLHKPMKLPSSMGINKTIGHKKVCKGDSRWKKFLPVGCTSPQEEKDEGYLSNKTSEGSSDVSNPFASRMS